MFTDVSEVIDASVMGAMFRFRLTFSSQDERWAGHVVIRVIGQEA